jgi:hypothetical protein
MLWWSIGVKTTPSYQNHSIEDNLSPKLLQISEMHYGFIVFPKALV